MAEEIRTVDFKTQLADERKLFTGKLQDTDFIPGSDTTLAKAKEDFKAVEAAFLKQKNERRQRIVREQPALIQTSVVSGGVLVNVEMPKNQSVLVDVVASQLVGKDGLIELPSDEILDSMDVAELITLAGNRRTEIKANVDNKATLIKKLKGVYVSKEDAKTVSLTGKSRAVLEEIGGHFKIDGTDKEKFPNVETLSEAIEKARK